MPAPSERDRPSPPPPALRNRSAPCRRSLPSQRGPAPTVIMVHAALADRIADRGHDWIADTSTRTARRWNIDYRVVDRPGGLSGTPTSPRRRRAAHHPRAYSSIFRTVGVAIRGRAPRLCLPPVRRHARRAPAHSPLARDRPRSLPIRRRHLAPARSRVGDPAGTAASPNNREAGLPPTGAATSTSDTRGRALRRSVSAGAVNGNQQDHPGVLPRICGQSAPRRRGPVRYLTARQSS